jgi:hypothetical protein
MGVFHSAALTIVKREDDLANGVTKPYTTFPPQPEEGVPRESWVRAVIKGADERSTRWRHVMVLGGLLIGFGPVEEELLSHSMRSTLEHALVSATNLALDEVLHGDELGSQCVALALNHSFPLLSDYERGQLDYNVWALSEFCEWNADRIKLVLPVLAGSAFFSSEGLQSAYFLGAIDLDIVELPNKSLNWPVSSFSTLVPADAKINR